MNIQAMMKQAQKLQKDMLKAKEEIDNTIFEGKSSIVTARVRGNKIVESIKINSESLDLDDIEMLEDMIMVAVNDAMKQIDEITEKKLGKFTQGMPGLF